VDQPTLNGGPSLAHLSVYTKRFWRCDVGCSLLSLRILDCRGASFDYAWKIGVHNSIVGAFWRITRPHSRGAGFCRQSHAKRRERLEQGAKFRVGSGVATISSMHMPSSASAGRSARSRSSSAAHRPSPGQPRAHGRRFERRGRDKDVRHGQAR